MAHIRKHHSLHARVYHSLLSILQEVRDGVATSSLDALLSLASIPQYTLPTYPLSPIIPQRTNILCSIPLAVPQQHSLAHNSRIIHPPVCDAGRVSRVVFMLLLWLSRSHFVVQLLLKFRWSCRSSVGCLPLLWRCCALLCLPRVHDGPCSDGYSTLPGPPIPGTRDAQPDAVQFKRQNPTAAPLPLASQLVGGRQLPQELPITSRLRIAELGLTHILSNVC